MFWNYIQGYFVIRISPLIKLVCFTIASISIVSIIS